jgi:stress response protein SCP2
MKMRENGFSCDNIVVSFCWNSFPKKRSVGLIAGLQEEKNIFVDCDGAVIACGQAAGHGDSHHSSIAGVENAELFDGAIRFCGDNIASGINEERFIIHLNRIPSGINQLLLSVNIFKNKNRASLFSRIESISVRVQNADDETDSIEYTKKQTIGSRTLALIIGKIYRQDGEWCFEGMEEECTGASKTEDLLKYADSI